MRISFIKQSKSHKAREMRDIITIDLFLSFFLYNLSRLIAPDLTALAIKGYFGKVGCLISGYYIVSHMTQNLHARFIAFLEWLNYYRSL